MPKINPSLLWDCYDAARRAVKKDRKLGKINGETFLASYYVIHRMTKILRWRNKGYMTFYIRYESKMWRLKDWRLGNAITRLKKRGMVFRKVRRHKRFGQFKSQTFIGYSGIWMNYVRNNHREIAGGANDQHKAAE